MNGNERKMEIKGSIVLEKRIERDFFMIWDQNKKNELNLTYC